MDNPNIDDKSDITLDAYIELNAFVGLNRLASTGGRAKLLIRSGNVFVNGEKETRNKRKLHPGDIMSYKGKDYIVKKEVCKMNYI
jgi:ribosome-associated protein